MILVGNLGQDPEIRYTPDGRPIANFSIATSETWKDKNSGERREKTEWHRIVAWRRLGEICGEYLHKGSQIYVEGRLRTRADLREAVMEEIREVRWNPSFGWGLGAGVVAGVVVYFITLGLLPVFYNAIDVIK